MTRIADVGAAVIGTGFIGTVHVEALRRIGVQVRGVLGSSPERGAARAVALGVARAYDSLDDLLADPAVQVVHVTSPNDLHVSQTMAILAAGRHVVCEKPLAMTAAGSLELVELAATTGLVNATNFNLRYYPLNQQARETVAAGTIGDVRLVTGRYFQDWLLLESDWNWRLPAGPGRGAASRRRHRVALAGSHDLHHRPADRVGHGGPDHVHRDPPRTDRPGRDVRDGTIGRDGRPADRHRGHRLDPAPLRGRGPRRREHLPDQPRPEELAPVRDRRIRGGPRLGLGAARPGLDRSPRSAERDPHPQPGPDGPRRPGGRRAARRARRGFLRHLLCTFPRHLRGGGAGRGALPPSRLSHVRRWPRRDAGRRRDRAQRARGPLGDRRPALPGPQPSPAEVAR